MNPSVSLANLLIGKMSFFRFTIYVTAQIIGAFLGAGVTFAVYYDQISNYELTNNNGSKYYSLVTGSLFATYPSENITMRGAVVDLSFGTFLLIVFVLALTDEKNVKLSQGNLLFRII